MRLLRKILFVLVAICGYTSVQSQGYLWDGGGDGTTWQDPLNWDRDEVPPSDSVVIFATSDTIVGNSTNILKVIVREGAEVLLGLDLSIGNNGISQDPIEINSNATLTFGSNKFFVITVGDSSNGITLTETTENSKINIQQSALIIINGGANGINIASKTSTFINRGTIRIQGADNGVNNGIGATIYNSGLIDVSGTFTRGIISSGTFINELSGVFSIARPDSDCIEIKGDSLINHGSINLIVNEGANSGDNGIGIGTAAEKGVFINEKTGSVLIDGNIGENTRPIYVFEEGSFLNKGEVNLVRGDAESRIYSRGRIINDNGGIINLNDGRININADTLINNGLILSTREGSGIFNTSFVMNNGFYKYDSIRLFATGEGEMINTGIDMNNPAETTIDYGCQDVKKIANTSYKYFEGSTLIGESNENGSLMLLSDSISLDSAFISPEGLPSVVLNVKNYSFDEPIIMESAICEGDSILFGGKFLSVEGVFNDTTLNEGGCEIISTLELSIIPKEARDTSATICEGETLFFYTAQLTSEGNYTIPVLNNETGCFVDQNITLTVIPTKIGVVETSICPGDSINFNGLFIKEAGTFRDTTQNVETGCIEIDEIIVSVSAIDSIEVQAEICEGDIYDFNGREITDEGVFIDTVMIGTGCLQVQKLTLTSLTSSMIGISDTICNGDSIDFGGVIIKEAGEYTNTLSNVAGCDSTIILNLTTIDCSTNTFDDFLSEQVILYPNPTNGKIYLSSDFISDINQVSIFNAQGSKISGINYYSDSRSESSREFDLSDASSGIYFVRIQTKNGTILKKFIKY